MSKKNNKDNSSKKRGFFGTIGRWFKRLFFGSARELEDFDPMTAAERARQADVEEIVSPAKQVFRGFISHKGAMFAVCVVIGMFLLVFLGPLFMPNYDDAYKETTQKNIRPGLGMMSVPKEIADDIKSIDSYGSFSVGISNSGKLAVWGDTKLGTTGVDIADIPEVVRNSKILYAAAGYDHIIAIDEEGHVYGWGNDRLGQFGYFDETAFPNIYSLPEDIANGGTVNVDDIKELECGYQASCILMKDGSKILWGNKNAYNNLEAISLNTTPIVDIDFTLNYVVCVQEDGNAIFTSQKGLYTKVRGDLDEETVSMFEFLGGRKIVSLSAAQKDVAFILEDGTVGFSGDYSLNEVPMGDMEDGEKVIDITSGHHHHIIRTDRGNLYSCGDNTWGQLNVPRKAESADHVLSAGFQNYAVDENGKITSKWGLKGYIFGTNGDGQDIFQRIINGGKMTMTIGAVAVIISSIIGIIVGCISGYFGGAVDIFLMRVTEIFSAIPFLPFALILSAIMGSLPWSENAKIFLIMCILGVLTWTGLARLVRGQVLVARESEYVTAAKAMGVKESKIAFKHILPNVISVILVTLTLDFAGCMLTESSLSYLGFGVTPPRPTWGNMLNGANNFTIISNFWWQWLFPAIFLAITTICINVVGDTLRDVMDPKGNSER